MPDPNNPVAPPEPGPNEVTDERALLLAQHVIHVQGGFTTPEREAERALADLVTSPGSIQWDKLKAEVDDALRRRMRELEADVTEVEAGRVQRVTATDLAAQAAVAEEFPDLPDGVEPGQIDMALVRRYRELREAADVAEAEKKAYKEEADKLEQQLVEMYSDAGLQNLSVDGKTVYLHRSTFAQRLPGVDAEMVEEALREAGAGDLIKTTVNANTLGAYVREFDEREEPLPEPIAKVLQLGERFSIRINAQAKKPTRRRKT